VGTTLTNRTVLAGVVAAVVAFPSVAVTQNSGVSVSGAVGFNTLYGDDFEVADAGFGVQGLLRYTTVAGFAFGGGVHYSAHGVDGLSEKLNVLGIYVEPRYVARLQASNVAPFIGGRVAWVRQSMTVRWSPDWAPTRHAATGYGLGGIGGILFQLSPQIGVETAVTFYVLSFGDASVNDATVRDSDMSGSSLGLQLALVMSFPDL
jgi:hypothetical protein